MDFMERRKVNIMCIQETKWKGSKAKELGNGFKLFYIGEDGRKNGVGIILNDEIKRGVLSVKRRSDRIIWVKFTLNGEIINTMSAYAPQTGCGENEKRKFWEEMDEELRDIPDAEKQTHASKLVVEIVCRKAWMHISVPCFFLKPN